MTKDIVYNEDCLTGLRKLPDECVDCCVTSPPYWGLRDYGNDQQLGLEYSPDLYVHKMVEVFQEVKRVLKPAGTLWLNIGDSYASSPKNRTVEQATVKSTIQGGLAGQYSILKQINKVTDGLKAKDLVGIPWMLAFALRTDGWHLRQEIIWAKGYSTMSENFGAVMPESVKDRFVKSHEQFFLLSKSSKYFFDLESIKKAIKDSSFTRLAQNVEGQNGSVRVPGKSNGTMKAVASGSKQMSRGGTNVVGHSGDIQTGITANKRSVWHHMVSGFSEAHFATFPQDLIVDCIKAGCPEGGIVLDPFMGAFTTALVAKKLNRHYIGFELNPEYIKIGERRLKKELGLFHPWPMTKP